ncbi:hypothetical protein E8E15_009193 [Penicillium rubens]|nr:uncharacterized protein N7525_002735 [Penicillium rubens]KAF3022348.1 hypothetical protein E8E15_009193 [Penicillium rubens]KAJ5055265.1 hypothetical protein NUH16_010827 [Penicillium rubens]KAJ5837547.1 hypothetical protein N7525_002735 [Penicillium rubens]KAJ5865739.1 hypothetical protein N7534_000292 [Penicillium rubens]
MPAVIRTSTHVATPRSKRQRIYAGDSGLFPYPPVPDDSTDPHEEPPAEWLGLLRSMDQVSRTTSSEWGSKEVATARATIEPTITPQNENLVRTYHPSLGPVDGVWVTKESNEKSIWLVAPGPLGIPHTHAGGREIHFLPAGLSPRTMTMICFKAQPDPIKAVLNPRRFLQSHDLHVIREMFPLAVGARVLISGFIVILFKSRADVEKSWTQDGEACTFGNLRLLYDVMEDSPTRTEVSGGAAIASKPDALETSVTLRLKLRLLDGQEVITVPTHAFVKLRRINGSCLRRLADWYAWMKTTLSRFTPAGKDSHEPALGTMRGSARNSPLGKIVFLAGDSRKIGVITTTYDPTPSNLLTFPSGFLHDLSLITAEAPSKSLPSIISPDGTPRVVGWGSYRNVLDGHPLFVMGLNVMTGNLIRRTSFGVSGRAQQALAEGSEYLWDKETLSQSVSILWRTEYDGDSPTDLSSATLCLGQISDRTCLAVCFQNFEFPLYSRAFLEEDHIDTPLKKVARPRMKGGFLLPSEVQRAEIICDDPEISAAPGTFPTRERVPAGFRRSSSHR